MLGENGRHLDRVLDRILIIKAARVVRLTPLGARNSFGQQKEVRAPYRNEGRSPSSLAEKPRNWPTSTERMHSE